MTRVRKLRRIRPISVFRPVVLRLEDRLPPGDGLMGLLFAAGLGHAAASLTNEAGSPVVAWSETTPQLQTTPQFTAAVSDVAVVSPENVAAAAAPMSLLDVTSLPETNADELAGASVALLSDGLEDINTSSSQRRANDSGFGNPETSPIKSALDGTFESITSPTPPIAKLPSTMFAATNAPLENLIHQLRPSGSDNDGGTNARLAYHWYQPFAPDCEDCTCAGAVSLIEEAQGACPTDNPSVFAETGVRIGDGALKTSSTDLSSKAFGKNWTQGRSWTNIANFPSSTNNGNGVVDKTETFLEEVTIDEQVYVLGVLDPTSMRFFKPIGGGQYEPALFYHQQMTLNEVGNEFRLVDTVGNKITYHDFSVTSDQQGKLKTFTPISGPELAVIRRQHRPYPSGSAEQLGRLEREVGIQLLHERGERWQAPIRHVDSRIAQPSRDAHAESRVPVLHQYFRGKRHAGGPQKSHCKNRQ